MRRLPAVLVRSAAAALVLTTAVACTSDGDGPSRSGSVAGTGSTAATDPAGTLATSLRSGLASVTSAHFELTGTLGGQRFTGAGDQKIDDGALTGLQAAATLPAGIGDVALVVDGKKRYAKLPPPFATAAKPWVAITSSSSNLVVKQLAGVLDAALAAADLGGLSTIAGAATSVRKTGSETVGGVPATRYALTIAPAKLPAELAATLGTKPIPATLWVDTKNRPVQVRTSVAVSGQPVAVTVGFSKFDAPVTITTPPASQVTTG